MVLSCISPTMRNLNNTAQVYQPAAGGERSVRAFVLNTVRAAANHEETLLQCATQACRFITDVLAQPVERLALVEVNSHPSPQGSVHCQPG